MSRLGLGDFERGVTKPKSIWGGGEGVSGRREVLKESDFVRGGVFRLSGGGKGGREQ